MCSDPGQSLIQDDIKELGLNRIVVAACSPRLHEPTFRRCVEEAGLNKFLFEFANLREQDSWVHMNQPEEADKYGMGIHIHVGETQKEVNDLLVSGLSLSVFGIDGMSVSSPLPNPFFAAIYYLLIFK